MRRFFVLLALVCGFAAAAAEFSGVCVRVSDGDTCTVQETDGTKFKIRLAAIDAPEKDQPFGPEAKGRLTGLLLKKPVKVEFHAVDRYGRILGKVTVDGVDAAKVMLLEGLAWHYSYFDKDPENAELEQEARAHRRGLWKQDTPVPPWDYRKDKKQK